MTTKNTDLLTSTLASFNYEYEEDNGAGGGGGGSGEDYNSVLTTTLTPSTTARLGEVINSTSLLEESDVAEFRSLMETRRHESNDFRVLIVCLGLSIVSLGLLSNLLFSLLVIACPKRHRRGTKITSTQLVMLFMCLAYFMFLILYCVRLTLHLQTDSVSSNSILKFNIYDNMENWLYGGFMCKVISSAPIWTKLVSRFSLMLIVLRRLCCKLCFFVQASQEAPTEESEKMNANDVNILERKGNKYDLHKRGVVRERSDRSRRFINLFCRVPWVFVLTCVVFCGSWLAILPLYMSFKLDTTTGICDSVYAFPDDVNKVAQVYFGYLVYGLAIPLGLTLILLVVLFVLNLGCISSYFSINGSEESIFNSQNTDSSDTSPTQTAVSAVKASSRYKSNKQKIITQAAKNKNTGNPSISSATASLDDDYNLLPFGRNSSSTYSSNSLLKIDTRLSDNNFLLWLVLFIQLATSLPPELYRYAQLKLNYGDDRVLNDYLESVLVRPMKSARPYYAMQLLYVSEFALIPFMFLLFYKCTAAAVRRSRANLVTTKLVNGANNSLKSTGSVKNAMSKLFYDCELYKGDDDRMNNVHLATAHAQAIVNKRMISNRSNSSSNNGLNQGSLNQSRQQANQQSRSKKLNQEKPSLASHQDTLLMPAASNHSYNPFPVTKKLLEANNLSNNSPKVQSMSKSNKLQHQQPMYDFITSEDISGVDTSAAHQQQQQQQQLVHIIQHPSWRINIKQQPQLGEQSESNGTSQQHYVPSNSSHLPFTYCRK